MAKQIKVLIVDDSALVREVLSAGLNADPDIEVVGTAIDAFNARDKIVQLKPDVLTLDVEMPKMDGVEFLRQLMPQYPIPVVMVSALTEKGKRITMDALDAGAVDFVTKPHSNLSDGLHSMMATLCKKVKVAANANVSSWKGQKPRPKPVVPVSRPTAARSDKTIVIGASTGGTEAIKAVVTRLPRSSPGVVIVQHMPPGFTKLFSERLNELSAMDVREAVNGDIVAPGLVLIAPGGMQMSIVRSGSVLKVKVYQGDKVNGHCPSVEVLMKSAAVALKKKAIGIMLTGMGGDGARGLKDMRDAGARTLAQDEATCVVFGMPKVAWQLGAAERLVPLHKIADTVQRLLDRKEELV